MNAQPAALDAVRPSRADVDEEARPPAPTAVPLPAVRASVDAADPVEPRIFLPGYYLG